MRNEPLLIVVTVLALALALLLELVNQQGEQMERSLDLPESVEAD